MIFLVAVVVGLGFGGGDQYLGSLDTPGLWTVSLSLLSAPWLVLPFVFGCSQPRAARAAAVGLAATLAALAGYFLMIVGPFEGGHWTLTLREIGGLLRSNRLNIAGGMIAGPLYGILGQRWRTRRAWTSAVLVAGALCLEPAAEAMAGNHYPGAAIVWPVEIVTGIAIATYFFLARFTYRRRGEPHLRDSTPV